MLMQALIFICHIPKIYREKKPDKYTLKFSEKKNVSTAAVYNRININSTMKNILKYFPIEFCISPYAFGLVVNI